MISVVVIGRNEEARLERCLTSIESSLGPLAHETVYVDSRSSDRSLHIARRCGARCLLLREESPTAGLGRLVGAKATAGEYLLFLDGDMQLLPGFVQSALMAIAQRGYDGVCGQRADIYMQGDRELSREANVFQCTQERVCPEFGGALFIKREALERAGGWSGNTIACEEAELHARLLDAGCQIGEIPVPMIVHTDAVRDNRNPLSVVFSRRRLGEGQALRCAMEKGKGRAYLRFERRKFALYALDLLCVLLLFLFPPYGLLAACFAEALETGFFISRGRIRAFVTQKLFFFAFPLGLLTYSRRSEECESV